MLLGDNLNLENIILRSLSKKAVSTVPQIINELRSQKLHPTIQGVYQVLRKLQREGIVAKEHERYMVSIPWILNMDELVKGLGDKFLRNEYISTLIPRGTNQKSSWNFSNLYKLNDFWTQLASFLINQSESRVILNYHPHPWWYLIQGKKEIQYIKTSQRQLKKRYIVIGGQTELDQWVTNFWKQPNMEFYLAPKQKWLSQDRTTSINIIDDYILLVKYDKNITAQIDDLFLEAKKPQQLAVSDVLAIFKKSVRAKITLQKNSNLAGQYRRKFERLFGPIKERVL